MLDTINETWADRNRSFIIVELFNPRYPLQALQNLNYAPQVFSDCSRLRIQTLPHLANILYVRLYLFED